MRTQLNNGSNKLAVKKPSGLLSIGKTFEKSKEFARDDTRAKAIRDLIMKMMALDDQPFTLVEDFHLIKHSELRFTTPSGRYFSVLL